MPSSPLPSENHWQLGAATLIRSWDSTPWGKSTNPENMPKADTQHLPPSSYGELCSGRPEQSNTRWPFAGLGFHVQSPPAQTGGTRINVFNSFHQQLHDGYSVSQSKDAQKLEEVTCTLKSERCLKVSELGVKKTSAPPGKVWRQERTWYSWMKSNCNTETAVEKNKVAESAGATPLRGALLSYMEELQHPKSRAEAGGWHAGLAPSESTCYGGCRGELHGGAAAVTQAKLKWGRGGKGREEEPAFIPHFSRSRFSCAK